MFWGREVRESFNDSLHSINWNVTSTPAMPFWLPQGGGSISDNTVSIIFPDLVPEDAKLFFWLIRTLTEIMGSETTIRAGKSSATLPGPSQHWGGHWSLGRWRWLWITEWVENLDQSPSLLTPASAPAPVHHLYHDTVSPFDGERNAPFSPFFP